MDGAGEIRRAVGTALRGAVAELPPAPAAAVKLLRLTRDDANGSQAIARVIETEPALAVKILRIVNSAYYGFPRRIQSIDRAVTLLGHSVIRQVALHLLVYDGLVRRGGNAGFDRVQFWQHSLLVAILSRLMGERLGHADADALYAAGLLHDLGKIVLEAHGRVRYSDFLAAAPTSGNAIVEDERTFFGVSHDQVGSVLCEEWGLPETVCRIQRLHHQGFAHAGLPAPEAQDVAIVSLANFIAWTQGIGSVVRHGAPRLPPEVLEVMDPARLDLGNLLERADTELKEIGAFYGLNFPSAVQLRANLLVTAIHLGGLGTRGAANGAGHPVPRASLTAPHHSLEPDEFIPWTLEAIQREFGFQRLLLMQIEPQRRALVATHTWPAAPPRVEPRRLELMIPDLCGDLVRCLRERRPLLIRDSQENAPALAVLGVQEAAAVPVMNQGRLRGILWLYGGPRLDIGALPEVLRVANELGIALEHSQCYQQEREKAQLDPLTRLYNRAAIDRFLQQAFREAASTDRPFSLGLLDIDHFKGFNDQFGHQAGDDVLRIVADSLRSLTRPRDLVGRYGGEEFLFALVETDGYGASRYAERIRQEIESRGRLLSARFPGHALTASLGVAAYGPEYANPAALVEAADQALYQAKRTGRNRLVAAWEARDQPCRVSGTG